MITEFSHVRKRRMARWRDFFIFAPTIIVRVHDQFREFDAATGLEARRSMYQTPGNAVLAMGRSMALKSNMQNPMQRDRQKEM